MSSDGKKVSIKAFCTSCGGTGVYQGMGERDGAYVICSHCKGTGCITVSYEPFTERRFQPKCKKVYKTGCGYVITDHDVTTRDGKLLEFSKAGVTYEEWLEGKEPKHMEFLGCPMLADQGACHSKEGFVDQCCKNHGGYFNLITECKYQPYKAQCWKRFYETKDKTK